jgi:hypothetical protein
MIKTMPFSTLKRHFNGELFAPVLVSGAYELQSANCVMVGSNGNPFKFKTAENALTWLDMQAIKTIKQSLTAQSAIDALEFKKLNAPNNIWIDEEIATLEARNAGDWNANLTGNDLLAEWGLVAKGDKGDKGDTGAAGGALVKGNLIEFLITSTAARQQISVHGFQGEPDFFDAWYQCVTANNGYAVGDKFRVFNGAGGINERVSVQVDAVNVTFRQAPINAFYITHKTTLAAVSLAADAPKWKIMVQPFKWVGGV